MLLQQINSQRPLSYSDQAGQGESRGWTGVGRRIQRRTIKCYDGCPCFLRGTLKENVKWRKSGNVGWIVNAEWIRRDNFRIKAEFWELKSKVRLKICGLFLHSPQICSELAVNRDHQDEVTFSSCCLFAPQGDRCWPHYREQTLHWWKPVGHAKYLVQYFNISSGPHSHRV